MTVPKEFCTLIPVLAGIYIFLVILVLFCSYIEEKEAKEECKKLGGEFFYREEPPKEPSTFVKHRFRDIRYACKNKAF